jgi:hypothetical protein
MDEIAADTTVSVGLRGSLPADTLLFIAVVAEMLAHVVDAVSFCESIGSIWGKQEKEGNKLQSLAKWIAGKNNKETLISGPFGTALSRITAFWGIHLTSALSRFGFAADGSDGYRQWI